MDIFEADKLVLFLAFVIPGFVSLKTYQLLFPGEQRSSSDLIIDAVAYSSLNYALLLLPILSVERSGWAKSAPMAYYGFYVFVFFAAPVAWVLLWSYLRNRQWVRRLMPHPTQRPWDFVFRQQKTYWAKVVLKDGTVIAGRYSDRSFTSSAPAAPEIFLEETWILGEKGVFARKKRRTAGVLVVGDIAYIEFRNSEEAASEPEPEPR